MIANTLWIIHSIIRTGIQNLFTTGDNTSPSRFKTFYMTPPTYKTIRLVGTVLHLKFHVPLNGSWKNSLDGLVFEVWPFEVWLLYGPKWFLRLSKLWLSKGKIMKKKFIRKIFCVPSFLQRLWFLLPSIKMYWHNSQHDIIIPRRQEKKVINLWKIHSKLGEWENCSRHNFGIEL